MAKVLDGVKVAILADMGFEQQELEEPRKALDKAGATTVLISPQSGKVKGWKEKDWGKELEVDEVLSDANPDAYDALLLPGGVMNPDRLRMNPDAVSFVRRMFEAGKPVAAICHGPWTLIEAQAVKGRRLTSWPSLMTDLNNAGGSWINEEVVRDGQLVTSRNPGDIPAFNKAMIEMISESKGRASQAA